MLLDQAVQDCQQSCSYHHLCKPHLGILLQVLGLSINNMACRGPVLFSSETDEDLYDENHDKGAGLDDL